MAGKEFHGINNAFATGCCDVNLVAAVVLGGWAQVPAVNTMGIPQASNGRLGMGNDASSRQC